MVVFTCNNCGDSIQKPKVDNHINVQCKKKHCSAASLCCVDCLTDFNAYTYVEHSKCLTELERYSKPGFVSKPSSKKGEHKQNSWIEVVRSVLNKPNLSYPQKQLLEILSRCSNVPRKKVKFTNFVQNSCKHMKISLHIIDSVFELIETEFKSSVASQESQNNYKISNPKDDGIQNFKFEAGNSACTVPENKDEPSKVEVKCKKRKKHLRNENENEVTLKQLKTSSNDASADEEASQKNVETQLINATNYEDEVVYSKKSKKHRKCEFNNSDHRSAENVDNAFENGDQCDEEDLSLSTLTKKEKKRLRKKQKYEELRTVDTDEKTDTLCHSDPTVDDVREENVEIKRKKNKKRKLEIENENRNISYNINKIDNSANLSENSKITTGTYSTEKSDTSINDEQGCEKDSSISKLTKKQKRLLHKTQKYEKELKNIENVEKPVTISGSDPNYNEVSNKEYDESRCIKNKKSKFGMKNNKIECQDITRNENENTYDGLVHSKQKIRTNKRAFEEDTDNAHAKKKVKKEPYQDVGVAETPNDPKKFDWFGLITEICKSHSNEIPLKRLRKKIISEYQRIGNRPKTNDEVTVILNKKIAKCPSVQLFKDKVVLIQ